jgi:pyridoxamine 5'-phosphate oxidase
VDNYFASRTRDSQLGAVASDQSAPLASRADLLQRFVEAEAHFANRAVERPKHWIGFCLKPDAMEFWQDRPHRLHERRRFTRLEDGVASGWTSTLLYP